MTNGEYIARIVEQNEDFCILTDDVAGTVTIEVSLDWWNQPKTEVLDKIRAEIKAKIEEEGFARSVFRHEEKDAVKAEQCTGSIMAYNNVIKLIDKYKESEVE